MPLHLTFSPPDGLEDTPSYAVSNSNTTRDKLEQLVGKRVQLSAPCLVAEASLLKGTLSNRYGISLFENANHVGIWFKLENVKEINLSQATPKILLCNL